MLLRHELILPRCCVKSSNFEVFGDFLETFWRLDRFVGVFSSTRQLWRLHVWNGPRGQVAAGGCRWLQVAAGGCRWLQVAVGCWACWLHDEKQVIDGNGHGKLQCQVDYHWSELKNVKNVNDCALVKCSLSLSGQTKTSFHSCPPRNYDRLSPNAVQDTHTDPLIHWSIDS